MEFLKSVIPLVDNITFCNGLDKSSHIWLLYDLVSQKKVKSDEEAQVLLYGTTEKSAAYKKLKQRLRDKLTEHVVSYGVTNKSLDEYARLYRKCMNQALAVKTLMLSYARPAATYIAENLLKTTSKNEFTDITLLLAKELHHYYSAISFQPRKFRKYERIFLDTQELYNREIEVMRYYCDLRIVFNTTRGHIKDHILTRAENYCDKITPYLTFRNTSYQLVIWIYEILTMRHEIAQDYDKLLQTSEKAIETFKKRTVSRKYALFRFDMNKVICYIQYNQNDKVESLANRYFKQMAQGSLNWFGLKIYVLVSRLRSKKYQEAHLVMSEMRQNKNYNKLPATVEQTLIVYEAHIEFLITINKIKSDKSSTFRIYKFLNEIPIYTKDKKGLNISILILHVLFLLQQKKYSKIIDRIDALNQYCHRHLRKDESFRSNCFIKMLLQMAKADFNPKRTERYVHPYLKKLHSMPQMVSDQSIEVEIIPYDHLWAMVVELLNKP